MAEDTPNFTRRPDASPSAALGRSLPHSLEAEEYLLSCCLLDGSDVISRCLEARIRPESFYDSKHGMIFVSPDYRAKTSWMGPQAESDMVQIIGDLKARYHIGKVILCGGSMGGTGCLTFAVRHPELLDGVASMNGTANLVEYGNFLDAISESYGGTKGQVPDEYHSRSAEFFPERLTMPVGITVGGKDELVPPASVERLAEKLKAMGQPVLIIRREDGGHATNYDDAMAMLEFVMEKSGHGAADAPVNPPAGGTTAPQVPGSP